MNRYAIENLFGIQGLNIAWYGIIIACGVLLGVLLAIHRAKKTSITKDDIFDLVVWMIPIGLVCARIYYVIFEWDYYKNNLASIFAINQGGLAIYGGVIGGIITVFVFCKIKKVSFLGMADLLIPSLVLGQAMGRWGNFINQEAFGNLITNKALQFFPYGVYINELGEWHQATFFYESICNCFLLAAMLLLYPKFRKKGYLIPFYMIGYGIIRFFIEGLRADSLYLVPGVRVSQVLSFVLVIGGIIVTILIKTKGVEKDGGRK